MTSLWNPSYLPDTTFGLDDPKHSFSVNMRELESSSESSASASATPRNSSSSLLGTDQLDMMSLVPNLWSDNNDTLQRQQLQQQQQQQLQMQQQQLQLQQQQYQQQMLQTRMSTTSISSMQLPSSLSYTQLPTQLSAQTTSPQQQQSLPLLGANWSSPVAQMSSGSSVSTSSCSSPLQDAVQIDDPLNSTTSRNRQSPQQQYASLTEENLSMLASPGPAQYLQKQRTPSSQLFAPAPAAASVKSASLRSQHRNSNSNNNHKHSNKSRGRKCGHGCDHDNCSNSSNGSKKRDNNLYKTEMCVQFQRHGYCPYGSKCQFAHGEDELKRVKRSDNWKTKPCVNWMRTGTCRYGKRCCFKHGDEDNGTQLVNQPPPELVMKKISMKLSQKNYYGSSSN